MRVGVATLAEHAAALCSAYGVRHDPIDSVRRARAVRRADQRIIRAAPVRTQLSYFVLLHELGHLVGPGRSGRRLEQEAAAWRFALTTALVEPSPATARRIGRYLSSYAAWAHNRQHRRRGRPWIPPRGHDFWLLLDELAVAADDAAQRTRSTA